jgi:hypothetical protein
VTGTDNDGVVPHLSSALQIVRAHPGQPHG